MKRIFACVIAGATLLGAAGAGAAGTDTLCVRFTGSAGGERVEIRGGYALTGTLPLDLCDLEADSRYRLTFGGGRRERCAGTLVLGERGAVGVSGLRIGSALRNGLLPGWGSAFSGRAAVGWSDGLSVAAAAYLYAREAREYRHLKNRSDILGGSLSRATSVSEAELARAAVHEASRDVNIQNRYRERLAVLTAALYAYQILDPWLSSPPPRCTIEGQGAIVRLDGPERSRVKAFLHSLVRPGRGQFYEGKTMRGLFFSSATVAAGLAALEYHNRYDEAAGRYETCVERFNASDNISEKERLIDEASRLWNDVEREKEYRNGAYAVLAGLWTWNLLDTMFPGGNGDVRSSYSMNLEAQGLALVFRF